MNLARSAAATILALAAAPPAGAQTGTVEFVARVTPGVGRSEPARRLPFYLLRKSFADIRKEAEEIEAKPDLERFVDSLDVSPELKAWMKRTRCVQLTGGEFPKKALPEHIFEVPEFFEAYITQNAGDVGFPSPKYTERDKEKNPQKYDKLHKEYRETLRKFVASNPHTMVGIEVHLTPVDPGQRWARELARRQQRVRYRALALAEGTHLVANTETDLEGRGLLTGIPAGSYWLSSLGGEAFAGDVRLRWDAPVTVSAGRLTRIELTNVNAAQDASPGP